MGSAVAVGVGSAVAVGVGSAVADGEGSAVADGSGSGEGGTVDMGSGVGDETTIAGSRSASTRAMAGAATFRQPATNINTVRRASSDRIMWVST
jgi:hypothetical protein